MPEAPDTRPQTEATSVDEMTGALFNIAIRARDGVALKDKWATGPHTYARDCEGLVTA